HAAPSASPAPSPPPLHDALPICSLVDQRQLTCEMLAERTEDAGDEPGLVCAEEHRGARFRAERRELPLREELRYRRPCLAFVVVDRKSTRLNSSHGSISYAVFCL